MEVNIYIGFWTLKVKCTQYGICSQAAFKNARAISKLPGRTTVLGQVHKISREGCPRRIWHPRKFVGGCFMSTIHTWFPTSHDYIPRSHNHLVMLWNGCRFQFPAFGFLSYFLNLHDYFVDKWWIFLYACFLSVKLRKYWIIAETACAHMQRQQMFFFQWTQMSSHG
jgi:hypothetical protein